MAQIRKFLEIVKKNRYPLSDLLATMARPREHAAVRDRTAARARRHVLRVEQPLVDAERPMKPHAVAEASLLRFRADP